MKIRNLSLKLMALLCVLALPVNASTRGEVDAVLALTTPPSGVVFEVVSGDANALDWAIPRIRGYVEELRARFPGLDIAVVTHGREQFALMDSRQAEHAAVHEQVQTLVAEQDVPVHICETHAGWRGVDAEEFPEYVDVAPAGPAQINNYRALGYILIEVTRTVAERLGLE